MYSFPERASNGEEPSNQAKKPGFLRTLFSKRNAPEALATLGFAGFFLIEADVALEYSGVSVPNALEIGLAYTTGALFVASLGGVAIRSHIHTINQAEQINLQQPPTSETE